MRTAFITGTAGFIGYHLATELLAEGWHVVGYDGMTDYYDVSLKHRRHAGLAAASNHFTAVEARLEDMDALAEAYERAEPDIVVHLAAQAGVRHSLEAPRSYVEANVVGTFNLMEMLRQQAEAARAGGQPLRHFLFASTSSVYGGNTDLPFTEDQRCDAPLTIYAATKRATEAMTHAYAHLYAIPTTGFRFFTVYGPWGRPDLALFRFVRAIERGEAIDVYNRGEMWRDFTYVTDLTRAIRLLIDTVPPAADARDGAAPHPHDTLSPVAPHRVVNIGAGKPVRLLDFIEAIEAELGIEVKRNLLDMQPGDLPATHASTDLLQHLTGFGPEVGLTEGVRAFVAWYREYMVDG